MLSHKNLCCQTNSVYHVLFGDGIIHNGNISFEFYKKMTDYHVDVAAYYCDVVM
jgi:hypothetical protein